MARFVHDPVNGYGGDRTHVPCPTIVGSPQSSWQYTVRPDGEADVTEADPGKPPYRVPAMAEIAELPLNGLVAVSTFSGAGGSCTGYRMAGIETLWANEFEPNAADAYAANWPATIIDRRDVRTVRGAEILEAIGGREVDLLDGSPPCQSFSQAGKRHRSWGRVMDHADGTRQRSDDLFVEFARLLGELRPRAFVAENVAGLVRGVSKGVFKEVMAALAGHGYRVKAKLLDAQWLGVPQHRERVIIIGLRDDLGLEPAFPSPLPYRYSLAEACPWIIRQGHSLDLNEWKSMGRAEARAMMGAEVPSPTIPAAGPKMVGAVGMVEAAVQLRARQVGYRGGEWTEHEVDAPAPTVTTETRWALEHDAHVEFTRRAHKDGIVRFEADQPVPTVNAFGGLSDARADQCNLADGVERRRLTIGEVKRICSFPDDYLLPGSYEQQWARLGNSVPPLMARAVGEAVAAVLAGS